MSLSSRELLKLATIDMGRGGSLGALEGLRRKLGPPSAGLGVLGGRQRAFIDALAATAGRTELPERYRSPVPVIAPLTKVPFGISDVVWLQRLPADPALISESDIKALARLAAQAESRSGDERLIRSIFDPIAAVHARKVAESDLAILRAKTPPPPPAGLQDLLAEAIAAEVPELSASEARFRAGEQIATAQAEVHAEHAASIAKAEAVLTKVAGPVAA